MKVFQFTASISVLAVAASFVLVACVSTNRRAEMTAEARKEAMVITLEWGRLAPFPPSAREVTIKIEGGSFTRTFRSHFKAPRHDIETWIKASPGLLSAESTYGDGKRKYIIKPGGGANRAEVTIGDDDSVEIYTSWS
ncbi:MAG TPA: hypothetical protein VE135_06630 [Pyrinomonadaceae bacterium]|nr:hypothetical protein [Pyrinomonadaceae bacterium]